MARRVLRYVGIAMVCLVLLFTAVVLLAMFSPTVLDWLLPIRSTGTTEYIFD